MIPTRKEAVRTNKELRRVLDESIQPMVQVELVRGLFQAYRDVYDGCRGYPERLDRDAMGQLRRIQFDTVMKSVAERFGLKVVVAPNEAGNCYHTRIQSGRLVLTASCVPGPKAMVRSAEFRKTYASDLQLTLDHPDFKKDEPDPDSSIYAILLHGVAPESEKKILTPEQREARLQRPGFARIAFPNRQVTTYVDSIDVMARFWNTIQRGGDGFDAEDVSKALGLGIRNDKKGRKRDEA